MSSLTSYSQAQAVRSTRVGWRRKVGLLVALNVLALFCAARQTWSQSTYSGGPIVPLFQKTVPATNPTKLVLLSDASKVVGWISGPGDYKGNSVRVQAGDLVQNVSVGSGNFFEWPYEVTKATTARFKFEDFEQALTLSPQSQIEPTVFFVIERTVYMPGQKLQFVAFLRRLDDKGQWQPVNNRAVEVLVTGQKKRNVAAKLPLTSDGNGRISGSYQWADADVLDNYALSIAGFKGAAEVSLAEFRKSKIRLKISGQREATKMRLVFEALDFLDKPVPNGKIRFTAQVVRKTENKRQYTLNAADFVYQEANDLGIVEPSSINEDERLLAESEPGYLPVSFGAPVFNLQQPVAQFEDDLRADRGKAEHVMDLKPEWLDGRYTVQVQGVLVDQNGHEQRASESVPLESQSSRLQLTIGRRYYAPGEPISVTAVAADENGRSVHGTSSLVVMRLSPGAPGAAAADIIYANGRSSWNGLQNNLASSIRITPHSRIQSASGRRPVWRPLPVAPPVVQRTLTTASTFFGERAEVKINEPGAYKLIAVTTLPDGKTIQGEIGCIVRDEDAGPALVLNLDKEEYSGGERLTGVLHSRFANAKVLLTIRDSSGLKLWQPIQMRGGVLRIDQPLPTNLNYGCTVEVQYVESDMLVHQSSKFVRIVPEDRLLKIETKVQEVYQPGETAKMEIHVNRNEPVDLVVSVYDQSLLGIAPDKSKNIRDFYWADERGRDAAQRDMLRRKLMSVTVEKLIAIAREELKEVGKTPQEMNAPETQMLIHLVSRYDQGHIYGADVVTLLQLSGVLENNSINNHYSHYWNNWRVQINKTDGVETRVFDLLETPQNGWRIAYGFYNDTLFVQPVHPNHNNSLNGSFARHLDGANYGFADGNVRWRSGARGDAWGSPGPPGPSGPVSANASFSISGQSFISHLPQADDARLIDLDQNPNGVLVRRDFSDAAYWNGLVRTDANGRATVSFKLPDSLTNWQVVVTAVGKDMRVGQNKSRFRTFKPVMVWPMLPRVFTQGDKVEVFATLHNHSDVAQDIRASIKVENGEVLTPREATVRVQPKSNAPVYWTFLAGDPGFTQILMSAECRAGGDASLKRLPVVAAAVTQVITESGFAKNDATLTIPSGIDLKTATLEVGVVPSLAADLADTLDYLVEYPHGCVEQTMSRFLPAIKVAQTLTKFKIDHPKLREKLPRAVEGGIKRLLELQQSDGGWGWQGGSQTHEMMTPYALYGLLEAEKAGYTIGNETALTRGLDRLKTFIDSMGEAQTSDRIYCMSVYSNRREMQPAWWAFIENQMKAEKLTDYALALALEMAARSGKKPLAAQLSKTLHERAKKSGGMVWWTTAGFSRWNDDRNEITAVALKALVAHNPDDALIEGVLSFFAENKRGNKWNSTKDTAMIVFAICDYLSKQETDLNPSKSVTVAVNGAGRSTLALDNGLVKKVQIPGDQLQRGPNEVDFTNAAPGMMYRLVLRYREMGSDIKPQESGIAVTRRFYLLSDKGARVREIEPGTEIERGSYIESEVDARNTNGTEMRYVLVDNPKPATCDILPADDRRFQQQGTPYALREDKTGTVVYHHEQTPAQIRDRAILHAELAGEFIVPPAQVEMMYHTQTRGHSGAFKFKVKDS